MYRTSLIVLGLLAAAVRPSPAADVKGDDLTRGLVSRWVLMSTQLQGETLPDLAGSLPARLRTGRQFIQDASGGDALLFEGTSDIIILAADPAACRQALPEKELTVAAWVSPDRPRTWGGLLCVLQDDGETERGWVLGFHERIFGFGLASAGADDGDGRITYLRGRTEFERGRWYHVAGTYDGRTMRLYVNGRLEAESGEQSGAILYPTKAVYALGGYVDPNEHYPFEGRIREAAVWRRALGEPEILAAFRKDESLAGLPPWPDPALRFVVEPYLQFVTPTGITVRWETEVPCTGRVEYGLQTPLTQVVEQTEPRLLHEMELKGLEPNRPYLYRVVSRGPSDRFYRSDIASFQTAVDDDTPFGFAVIGDTQSSPETLRRIAELCYAERPSFAVIAGDLVSTGPDKSHWTGHFFPNMAPLIRRVAFFPAIGNHEEDARHYYDYMSLPEPEYRYRFTYGNAEFFMIDSNRPVDSGSEQYRWLEQALASSRAAWKFVVHHHPPFSSDSDDYGDTAYGPSTGGDPRMRALVPLYERFGVDIVWSGHIHLYERTWPIRDGRAVQEGGVIYIITGGGGGQLEEFAPTRTWFGNKVHRQHHYCFVSVNRGMLEVRAVDENGRLFDRFELRKNVAAGLAGPVAVPARR